MRFMVIRKADDAVEAGEPPSTGLLEAMGRYNEELAKAGALLAGEGLMASDRGTRLRFDGTGGTTVTDGPFTETKELVAGFTILRADSLEDAIELVKRWPAEDGGGNVEIEIRRLVEAEDFGDALTEDNRGYTADLNHRTPGE